jgi:cell division protein FtsB
MKAQHSFEMLAQSIKSELAADNKELTAAKTTKAASSEVKATAEADLAMTEKMLAEGKTYLADLSQDCQTKASDWEVSSKARAEELQALSDALKIIKEKTGGATSRAYDLLEVKTNSREMSVVGGKVLDTLRKLAKGNDVALSQLSLQFQTAFEMSSGADVFGKVKSMITEMIDKLVAEAAEEADHKAWCDKEMSEAQEKIADHTSMVDKLSSKIDKASASIAQITESVAQLQAQLADIAKQQATMDEMRAEEKAAYVKAKKDYEDGVEGLTMALEILREYYSAEPALLQQPSVSTHSASGDAATGIIGILEVSQSDFSKLLADANVEEETAVKEYEKVSHENAVQKTMKEQDVKYQLKEKASLEKNVADFKEDRSSEQAELDAVLEYFSKVKPGCTTKPMTYAERKQRRENEIAGLKEALTILDSESPAAFLAIRTARRVA